MVVGVVVVLEIGPGDDHQVAIGQILDGCEQLLRTLPIVRERLVVNERQGGAVEHDQLQSVVLVRRGVELGATRALIADLDAPLPVLAGDRVDRHAARSGP